MARISLDPPQTMLNRFAGWYSRRMFGAALSPGLAVGHNRKVMMTYVKTEQKVEKWNSLDPRLKTLAVMASAAHLNCAWCMDFGYWKAAGDGIDEKVLRDVPRWRDSRRFTDLERDVMAYAEAMSASPVEVTDQQVDQLRTRLGEPALVELTMMIAIENQRARFNSALGLPSQGFADRCELRPLPVIAAEAR